MASQFIERLIGTQSEGVQRIPLHAFEAALTLRQEGVRTGAQLLTDLAITGEDRDELIALVARITGGNLSTASALAILAFASHRYHYVDAYGVPSASSVRAALGL